MPATPYTQTPQNTATQNSNVFFGDEKRLTDALNSQKYITDHYNTFANETATPQLKSTVMQILADEHQIQHEVFCEMNNRGWYQTTPAESQKLQNAITKYENPAF